MSEKVKNIIGIVAICLAALIILAWVASGMVKAWKSMFTDPTPVISSPVQSTKNNQAKQSAGNATMHLTKPTEKTLIWPLVECLRGTGQCNVVVNRLAALRRGGKKTQLCLLVDKKAQCIPLPAQWSEEVK